MVQEMSGKQDDESSMVESSYSHLECLRHYCCHHKKLSDCVCPGFILVLWQRDQEASSVNEPSQHNLLFRRHILGQKFLQQQEVIMNVAL